ncbi:hypothetical protein SUGI_0178250 [Cryptomeria japonica]|nr:hypothetical protein SUGI_0178250 [Cryptomeria japonica]
MQAGGERGGDVEIASTSRTGQPLPLPKPKTPPRHPDIHGKYRKQAELKHLDQEISLLEEELRSLEGLPPASRCCKEVEEFIHTHPDPLLQSNEQVRKSFCSLKIIDIKVGGPLVRNCHANHRVKFLVHLAVNVPARDASDVLNAAIHAEHYDGW